MSKDIIYREDAIEAMEQRYQDILRIFKRKVKDGEKAIALDMIGCIKSLPSADRPQGEWVKHDDERDYCSRCKHIFKTRTITQQDKWTLYIGDLGYNYCPNCGADMRKGADD